MAVENFNQELSSSQKEFESLLNEDFKDRKLKENEIIKATVTEINKNFIVVDCKAKMEGMIPIEEFKNDDELSKLEIGSKIEIYLERIESAKGELVISREKARRMNAWNRMEKVFETGEEITAYITGRIKGGFIATCDGLPTFMPASQIDVRPLKKFDHLMNVPLKVIATRIDKVRGNVCTSRRAVLEKSKDSEAKEALKNLSEGDIIDDAKVKATTDWGIFLDIKGIDALLHVSDLSHGRVKKPSDLVTIGQTMKVKITKIDKLTNRVSASVKALTVDPYDSLEKKYKIGTIYSGTVTKLMDYGAFVRLEDGIEGLIHSSELSWTNKNLQPSKVLSASQDIKVKIVSIDSDAKRISLSLKETLPNPWKEVQDQVGSITEVTINNITDKAIFADLSNGLTGMLHYRELSYNEEDQDLKKFKKGQKIKVKILELKEDKLRFSIKALQRDPFDWFKENNKKEGSIITTRVHEVLRTGVKVSVDPDKNIIVMIKKNQLAKESSDARPEIFVAGNALDAMVTDLDLTKREVVLSVKAAQVYEEKSLVAKFGVNAAKSGATLAGIFQKALGKKPKKTKKEEE
ncbi:S1 RNA-binding domain-containing protein [Pelagibacteraceae bacterium]|jgi:small subunit ribosomal protein S1|nr:S1 RNA-binding domain-containing protein [Pelagibacteraceae bacterium]